MNKKIKLKVGDVVEWDTLGSGRCEVEWVNGPYIVIESYVHPSGEGCVIKIAEPSNGEVIVLDVGHILEPDEWNARTFRKVESFMADAIRAIYADLKGKRRGKAARV